MLISKNSQSIDGPSLKRHFGGGQNLLSLWIAEPYVELAPEIVAALGERAGQGWYGYETRTHHVVGSFWQWMSTRHNWQGGTNRTLISPSVGTSIGVLLQTITNQGDRVILQPPVFTDFKTLVNANDRQVVRNILVLGEDGYKLDLEDLEKKAADPATRALILCNPHNPVGRVWTPTELSEVATICANNSVFVIADEIHADITLEAHRFTPFATVANQAGARWAALHGPIKTFGLAGVCDTLMITDDDEIAERFQSVSSQLHLTRNNVFGLAAFEAAYTQAGPWFDEFRALVEHNAALLRHGLPEEVGLIELEGTYLAWLDFRALGLEVPELANWLALSARLALSPGHWFGREGAGFARMTLAAPTEQVADALERLHRAIATRQRSDREEHDEL